MKTIVAV